MNEVYLVGLERSVFSGPPRVWVFSAIHCVMLGASGGSSSDDIFGTIDKHARRIYKMISTSEITVDSPSMGGNPARQFSTNPENKSPPLENRKLFRHFGSTCYRERWAEPIGVPFSAS